jgi:hypothetical protein
MRLLDRLVCDILNALRIILIVGVGMRDVTPRRSARTLLLVLVC